MAAEEDLLKKYKKHPFADGLLPFGPTLKALGTAHSRVFAKQDGRQRWVITDTNTGEPAIFSHAALFAQADDMETGNFVPPKQDIPHGVEDKVVQRWPSTRCFYTYVLDTYADLSLFEGQWVLDDYMKSVKGFNQPSVPRRSYMSGQDSKYRSRFWMQTPMFLRREADKEGANVQHLHPWVVEADEQLKLFRANPDRPRVWVKDGTNILPIGECDPNVLQRGDLVAISFTVTYHITRASWFPQYHPADILVLRQSQGDPTDYSSPTIDLSTRPAPELKDLTYVDSDSDDERPSKRRKVDDNVGKRTESTLNAEAGDEGLNSPLAGGTEASAPHISDVLGLTVVVERDVVDEDVGNGTSKPEDEFGELTARDAGGSSSRGASAKSNRQTRKRT